MMYTHQIKKANLFGYILLNLNSDEFKFVISFLYRVLMYYLYIVCFQNTLFFIFKF